VVADLAGSRVLRINYAEPSIFMRRAGLARSCGIPSGKHQDLHRLQVWIEHLHPTIASRCWKNDGRCVRGEIERYDVEYRCLHPTQGAEVDSSPGPRRLRDATGRVIRIYGVVQDITDRKQADAELQRLRLHLWHADRVAQTGAITASLAHELNQPLAAILSNAQAGLRFMDC